MRAYILVFALMLPGIGNLRSEAAEIIDIGTLPINKASGHGFEWFFANMRRPEEPCVGQHVVATWYATGHFTANGDVFDPNGHTAAHRTLPFGSHVTVVNPRNGKTITVIINDRGPFTKGVTLDLARGAAHAIGMKDTQWVCMSEASQ